MVAERAERQPWKQGTRSLIQCDISFGAQSNPDITMRRRHWVGGNRGMGTDAFGVASCGLIS